MQTRHDRLRSWAALAAALALAALAGCASFPPATFPAATATGTGAPAPAEAAARGRNAAALESAARKADPAARPTLQLQAARAWLQAGRSADAARSLESVSATLTPVQLIERRVLEADIEFANGRAQQAWQKMSAIAEPTGTPAAPQYLESRMRIALGAARPVDGVRAEMSAERLANADAERSVLRSELLALLRAAREQGVKLEPEASQDPTVRG